MNRPTWKDFRDAGTLSNLAYPFAAAMVALVLPFEFAWKWILATCLLGVFSGFWHWLGHPWNLADRWAMFLTLVLTGLVGSVWAAPVFVVAMVASRWVSSTAVVGLLAACGLIRLGLAWDGNWLPFVVLVNLYLVAVAIGDFDRKFEYPHRRGPYHWIWHLTTASALGLHLMLAVQTFLGWS